MAESSSGAVMSDEDMFADPLPDDPTPSFDGFQAPSPVIGNVTAARLLRAPVLKLPTSASPAAPHFALNPQNSSMNNSQDSSANIPQASSANNPQDSSANNPLASSANNYQIVLLMRTDKKPLPFNIVSTISKSWTAFSLLTDTSLYRNARGTVITGELPLDRVAHFRTQNLTFDIHGNTYILKEPKFPSRHMGEISFDLKDMEDRSILQLPPDALCTDLVLPFRHSNNKIVSVTKLYPSHVVEDSQLSTFHTMRIAIEFTKEVPDRVFYQMVSLRVRPYSPPPPRCFSCQRYGHGAISCRRQSVCTRCSSPGHTVKDCAVATTPRCVSCKGPHTASSARCPFYTRAQDIFLRVLGGVLTREAASVEYAALYHTRPSRSPAQSLRPAPASPTPHSSFQAPASQVSSTPSSLPSSFPSSIFTPAQPQHADGTRAKKRKQAPLSTPPHLTDTYSQILSGASWSFPPAAPPSSSPPQVSLSSPPSPSAPPPITSFGQVLQDFLKTLVIQFASFLSSYLASSPSPFASALQPLLTSLICHFTAAQ